MGPLGVVVDDLGRDQIAGMGAVAKQRLVQKLVPHFAVVAYNLLDRDSLALEEVAARVGYGSAITVFNRHTGQPPGRFAKAILAVE